MLRFNLKYFLIISLFLHAGVFALASGIFQEPEPPIIEAKPIKVGIVTKNPGSGAPPKTAETPPAPPKPVEKKISKTPKKRTRKIISRATPVETAPSPEAFTVAEEESDAPAVEPEEPSSGGGSSAKNGDEGKGEGVASVSGFPNYGLNPKPEYPMIARRNGYEGVVLLRVFVLESGNVGRIQLDRSSGYRILDKSALDAVRDWVFIPGKKSNGAAVSSWVTVPIRFQLSGG